MSQILPGSLPPGLHLAGRLLTHCTAVGKVLLACGEQELLERFDREVVTRGKLKKATELGVQRITPFVSRHTVGLGARTDRRRRIVVAAAKQSGRTRVPGVDAPVPWPAHVALSNL